MIAMRAMRVRACCHARCRTSCTHATERRCRSLVQELGINQELVVLGSIAFSTFSLAANFWGGERSMGSACSGCGRRCWPFTLLATRCLPLLAIHPDRPARCGCTACMHGRTAFSCHCWPFTLNASPAVVVALAASLPACLAGVETEKKRAELQLEVRGPIAFLLLAKLASRVCSCPTHPLSPAAVLPRTTHPAQLEREKAQQEQLADIRRIIGRYRGPMLESAIDLEQPLWHLVRPVRCLQPRRHLPLHNAWPTRVLALAPCHKWQPLVQQACRLQRRLTAAPVHR